MTRKVFLSTPSARRATSGNRSDTGHPVFLSTPSARRATLNRPVRGTFRQTISIHALREEGDKVVEIAGCGNGYFYPRPPRGGRPMVPMISMTLGNFYPRPPRGGRPSPTTTRPPPPRISIHALREEGDTPLSSRNGGSSIFLSTPSARRATGRQGGPHGNSRISIHALREEGDSSSTLSIRPQRNFYPRPPRGGRPAAVVLEDYEETFLSTPSARRATFEIGQLPYNMELISIHALREEGDHGNLHWSYKL